MYIRSVLLSFPEAVLKRRLGAIEAEIKLLICQHSLKHTWQYKVVVDNGRENN